MKKEIDVQWNKEVNPECRTQPLVCLPYPKVCLQVSSQKQSPGLMEQCQWSNKATVTRLRKSIASPGTKNTSGQHCAERFVEGNSASKTTCPPQHTHLPRRRRGETEAPYSWPYKPLSEFRLDFQSFTDTPTWSVKYRIFTFSNNLY